MYQNIAPPTAFIFPFNPAGLTCVTPSLILTNSSSSNVPAIFSPTQAVIAFAWYGPVPQSSVSLSANYIAYTGGTYTFVAKDLNNGCTAMVVKTIIDNRIFPVVSSGTPFNINCPVPTATIYPLITGPTAGFTYSWTVPASASVTSLTQPTIVVNTAGIYTITVTNALTSCATTTIVNVTVCAGLTQNNLENNGIKIFPNPNNGVFIVEFDELASNSVIEIYTSLGVLINKQTLISTKSTLNLENAANGLYFIYVNSGEKAIKVSKIVKN
jgi:hypothetical protein